MPYCPQSEMDAEHLDVKQEVAKLGPTMWFGETSLLKREPRPNNVVSETAVDLLLLDRTDVNTILGPLQTILDAQAANFGPTSVKKVILDLHQQIGRPKAPREGQRAIKFHAALLT